MTAILSEDVSGQGVLVDTANTHPRQRSWIKSAVRKCLLKCGGVIERLPTHDGLLLTFDDGPDPDVTPAVLDLLAKYDAKAVFFVVGNRIPRAPQMLSRIIEEGHLIGNHTFTHPLDHVAYLPNYIRDLSKCQAVLESYTEQRPTLFRPPLGSITLGSLLAPRFVGLQTMLWSIDVGDWMLRRSADAGAAGQCLAETASPGDIALLHDDNPCVIPLLTAALPLLRQRQLELNGAIATLYGDSAMDTPIRDKGGLAPNSPKGMFDADEIGAAELERILSSKPGGSRKRREVR